MAKKNSKVTFGFVLKYQIKKANEFAQEVANWLLKKGCKVIISSDAEDFCQKNPKLPSASKDKLPLLCDIILIFGGDGTFLSVARYMDKKSVPVLGINLGRLGFLTEVSVEKAFKNLQLILNGEYELQERSLLDVCVIRKKKEIYSTAALNDAVVTNKVLARIIDLQVFIDGVEAASVRADGLIVSTPTGSTAYSLAAGGPILHPTVSAHIITAICPHSLTIRPIVVPDSSTIELKIIKKDGLTLLTIDGQSSYDLMPGDIVRIKRFTKHPLKIIHFADQNYFELLRNKLKLGARGDEQGTEGMH